MALFHPELLLCHLWRSDSSRHGKYGRSDFVSHGGFLSHRRQRAEDDPNIESKVCLSHQSRMLVLSGMSNAVKPFAH
jgi:hypothetical protein